VTRDSPLLSSARRVRLVGFDVDGVLTDGRLWYSSAGAESKAFHVLDGMGLQMLSSAGIAVCIISARPSAATARRCQELGIARVVLGTHAKRPAFESFLSELALDYSQAAFMGDDLPDLSILARVGLAATVPTAFPNIQAHAHWCATRPPGQGAVREFCEFLLDAQGLTASVLAPYLDQAR